MSHIAYIVLPCCAYKPEKNAATFNSMLRSTMPADISDFKCTTKVPVNIEHLTIPNRALVELTIIWPLYAQEKI